jgi:RNA polymerase sigma-70 factor (ECF subfamily)
VTGPDGTSDEELLTRHLDGDRGAFAELLTRHERRVYGICLRMLGNPEDAADATQEAFLAVLRKAGTFRGGAAFSTWLYRVAMNAAIDQGRRRMRVRAVPLGDQLEAAAPVEGGSEDPGDTVATAVTVQTALASIPGEFRAAVVLCDLCRLPYSDAAEVLEVAVGTVKSRVFRGRAALAKELRALDPRAAAAGQAAAPDDPGTPGASQTSDESSSRR